MDLRLLVISDTHLGEDTSVLNFAEGVAHLGKVLGELGLRRVEELVLLGDIPDRTLSSTAQIIDKTSAFMTELTQRLDIQRLVYVPGNHDHTLWTSYLQARYRQPSGISSLRGESLVKDGIPVAAEGVAELLALFFGKQLLASAASTPPSAGRIARVTDFVIANPAYVVPADHRLTRTCVLMHGTHFRQDVVSDRLRKAFDEVQLDRLLGHTEIESGGKIKQARDLADLERRITPFVDTLWASAQDQSVQTSDKLWFVLTAVSGKFMKRRDAPAQSAVYTWDELRKQPDDRIIKRLTPGGHPVKSLERFRDVVRKHLLACLAQEGHATQPLTFIYGDTHDGGWGAFDDLDMRVYNTGAWVVHNAKHHPPCHLFAVDDQGRELLLDVSFQGVECAGEGLLVHAARNIEHRHHSTREAIGPATADKFTHEVEAAEEEV